MRSLMSMIISNVSLSKNNLEKKSYSNTWIKNTKRSVPYKKRNKLISRKDNNVHSLGRKLKLELP